jgi:hypothetical protein
MRSKLSMPGIFFVTVVLLFTSSSTIPKPAGATAMAAWPLSPRLVPGMPGVPSPVSVAGAASASDAQCREYSFPVTTSQAGGAAAKIWGQLCTDDPVRLGEQPVQVLIHGGAYDHTYFDWPYQPDRYNYVRSMTRQGFTVLNFDRLGYGHSDHPLGASLTFDVAAFTVHQLIQHLRRGSLGRPFPTIVTNGFSMGGLIAQVEAATFHDVDALTTHAVGHYFGAPRSLVRLATVAYPALLDPKFSSRPWALDPTYLTTMPGRRVVFYGPPGAYDPAQLEYEEKDKDVVTATELADIVVKSYTELTQRIDAPILWTLGEYDQIWCGTTDNCFTDPETAGEASHYKAGLFTKYIAPDDGHSVILGLGTTAYQAEVVSWLRARGIRGVR